MAPHSPDDGVTRQPRYHGSDEDAGAGSAREPLTARQRRARVLLIVVAVAAVLTMVILHITGVLGPGTNG